MLTPHGYAVALALSGGEGLAKLHSEPPDLVLLDILMPDMTGYDVCRRIREDPATRLLPVVMLTSSGDQDKVNAIEAGADDFIGRPFNPQELLSRVRSLLRIKEYHDTIQKQTAELAEWNRTLEERVHSQLAQLEGLDRLRRYFSAPVADVIMSGGAQLLEPHRREVTILFCDLRGFTAFAANAEPEEVMSALSQFYEAVGELILRYEATLEQIRRRSLIHVQHPMPLSSPARRCVLARRVVSACRPCERCAQWLPPRRGHRHRRWSATLGRVGFAGRFGSSRHRDRVISASVLASAWPPVPALPARLFDGYPSSVSREPVGPLQLKGFHDRVKAYNVTSLRE